MTQVERELRRLIEQEMDDTTRVALLLAAGHSQASARKELAIPAQAWPMIIQRISTSLGRPLQVKVPQDTKPREPARLPPGWKIT